MSSDILPSVTIKCLFPFVLTPVTRLTNTAVLPIIERPGSIINVMSSVSSSRIESIRSVGVGISSPERS